MEKAKVYYSDLRTSPTSNLLDKMERLLKRAGIEQLPLKDINPEKPDVPLNKNDAFQKVQKRRVQEKR